MAFSRVNPLGWALFEELTSAQMNQLDLNASRAIDGTFGGTYNPSGPININGTVYIQNLDVGALTGDAVFTSLVVNGLSTFNGDATFNDRVYLNDVTTIDANVQMNSGSFTYDGGNNFRIASGTLRVSNLGVADFETEVFFEGTSEVFVNGSAVWEFANEPEFSGGALFNGGSIAFYPEPYFYVGLEIDNSLGGSGIRYTNAKVWNVRAGWGQARPVDFTKWEMDTGGYWIQTDEQVWPVRMWWFPQGLWSGGEAEITRVEFRVRANGLSGTPSNDTYFNFFVTNDDFDSSSTAQCVDNSPNSSSDHGAVWTGSISYNPDTEIIGATFLGYRGGDTLNGSSKWYEVKSVRITFNTEEQGVY